MAGSEVRRSSCGSRLCIAINSSVSRGPGTTALRGFSRRTFQITHHRTEANALGHKPTREQAVGGQPATRAVPVEVSRPGRAADLEAELTGTMRGPSLQKPVIAGPGRRKHKVEGSSKCLGVVFLSIIALKYCFKPVFFLCRKLGILTVYFDLRLRAIYETKLQIANSAIQ